jgi:hypothetical protein
MFFPATQPCVEGVKKKRYDKNPTVGSSSWTTTRQYNGNITGTIWKSVHDGQIRKYNYSYDPANYLTS